MATRKNLPMIHDDTDYYQHQVDGVRWGVRKPSFINADEMGLGKSLQAATVAAVDFNRGQASHVLIVVPAFLRYNWLEELERHTHFNVMVLAGTPLYRHNAIENFATSGFDIMIVSYDTLANDKDYFDKTKWDIVIVDEAHYIKNPQSKRSKAVRGLPRRRGFLLTGSPLLN